MPRKDLPRKFRDKFARDNGLPLGRLLSREYVLSVAGQAICALVPQPGFLPVGHALGHG